jgi:NAD-dependent deacetylase
MHPLIELTPEQTVLFFTGAGMSAESGMPIYRGQGGIWSQYRYEEYACQRAFDRDPGKVQDFHELRRERMLACAPHAGYLRMAEIQKALPRTRVITQNIDGLHQRAGIEVAAELHGSAWRLRCAEHGVRADVAAARYARRGCEHCGNPLRPDIIWFEDSVDAGVFRTASELISACDVFVAIGTSGVVWPAAGFARAARAAGAYMIEINPEDNEASPLYTLRLRLPASTALLEHFTLRSQG